MLRIASFMGAVVLTVLGGLALAQTTLIRKLPQIGTSRSAMSRATMSGALPTGKQTIARTGRLGKSPAAPWAPALRTCW